MKGGGGGGCFWLVYPAARHEWMAAIRRRILCHPYSGLHTAAAKGDTVEVRLGFSALSLR